MKVVIDTNVFMSALIKDSITREILLYEKINFYLPEYALGEVKKYKSDLLSKGNYDENELEELFLFLLQNIAIVPKEDVKEYMQIADEVMRDIDIDDSSFIAAALAINADGIWSYDRHFLQQDKIKVFTTEELREGM